MSAIGLSNPIHTGISINTQNIHISRALMLIFDKNHKDLQTFIFIIITNTVFQWTKDYKPDF